MIRPRGRYIIFTSALFVILFIPISRNVWNSLYYYRIFRRPVVQSDITIVTMYLNIGGFLKGGGNNYFSPGTYRNWMVTWGWLTNRVVGFFDNDDDLEKFREIRSSQPHDRTLLIKLDRNQLPAFKHLEKIRRIYENASYPKHTPNTVLAEYSTAMNAKYDVLQMAIDRELVYTDYMAWLDIGLFRNLLEPRRRPANDRFTLELPDHFNASSVAMSAVDGGLKNAKITPWQYMKDNQVWVSGAFALGTKKTMKTLTTAYQATVKELLDKNLSSTDQQVIGVMYSRGYIKRQKVDVVGYECQDGQFGLHSTDIVYFCLAYICKDAAERRLNMSRTERMAKRN